MYRKLVCTQLKLTQSPLGCMLWNIMYVMKHSVMYVTKYSLLCEWSSQLEWNFHFFFYLKICCRHKLISYKIFSLEKQASLVCMRGYGYVNPMTVGSAFRLGDSSRNRLGKKRYRRPGGWTVDECWISMFCCCLFGRTMPKRFAGWVCILISFCTFWSVRVSGVDQVRTWNCEPCEPVCGLGLNPFTASGCR